VRSTTPRMIRSAILTLALVLPAAASGQTPAPAPQPQQQAAQRWEQMPRMQLERVWAGPLKDTLVQRWRDPNENVVCYLYMPVTAIHSQPTDSGYVHYGSNIIGSISCVPAPARAARPSR
jgi:hypothetical protein